MSAPRIFIASPTPGFVKTAYMHCVIATLLELGARGIQTEFSTEDGSSIEIQRNVLASRFLNGPCTHILFVDTDMMFPADLCAQLLLTRKAFIGAICSSRHVQAKKIDEALKRGLSFNDANLFGYDWLYHQLDPDGQIKVENYIMQVAAIGFGIVLIQRSVFETMVANGSAKPQKNTNLRTGEFFNFFLPHPEIIKRGQTISEDYSFCRRWRRDCNGEIWGYTNAPIYHLGDFGYGGTFFDYLQSLAKLKVASAIEQS